MGCVAEMTENIKKEHPYSRKQWRCLLAWVNAFLDCGRANGCGDYPVIPDVPNPCLWVAEQVHTTLAQIHPDILGGAPKMWSRNWLNRVVQALKAGWPGCEATNFELLFEHEIIPTIEPWMGSIISGSCGASPVISWGTKSATDFIAINRVPSSVFDQNAFPSSQYVEWRQTGQYSAAGLSGTYGTVTGPLLPEFQSDPYDVSEWYSFTQQKMVEFDELCEDDFHFTTEEFLAQTVINRYPQSIQIQNAVLLAALNTLQTEPTQEASDLVLEMSPWATQHWVVLLVSPFQTERGSWGLAPGAFGANPIDSNIPVKTTVRVPTTFRVECPPTCTSCNGSGCEKPLAAHAQYLWALRWKQLQHIFAESQWTSPYSSPWLPNTGLAAGTQVIWTAGSTLMQQHAVFASQWNIAGQMLRIDLGSNTNLWYATSLTQHPIYSPCTGLWGAAGSTLPQKMQIGVVKDSGTFNPPECADDWHY